MAQLGNTNIYGNLTVTGSTKLGTSTVGGTTTPIYLSAGVPTALSYTIEKSVPSNAVFTDTKVTSVGNHYTPSADSASALNVDASSTTSASWASTSLVTGVNISRDARGHVTGLTVDSIRMPSNPTSDFDYRGKANTWSAVNTFSASSTVSASSGSGSGTINITAGGLWAAGGICGNKVYNAVWNDLADCIPVDDDCETEPGYCYCFDGEKYYKSSKYLDDGIIGIYSDTYGMHMGYKPDLKQIPIAVAGFALAYVDKEYPVGTPLTCTENGYLTKIEKSDKIEWPEKIIATYWKNEPEEYWGDKDNKIKVNGRKWVKIR